MLIILKETLKHADLTEDDDTENELIEKIKTFICTRWTFWHLAFARIEENVNHLCKLWDNALDNDKGLPADVKARVIGVNKKSREFKFYFYLHLGILLDSQMDTLSLITQSKRMTLLEGKNLGALIVKHIKESRTESKFALFCEKFLKHAEKSLY